jgi:MFS family permease
LLGLGESLYGPTADALPAALAPPALRGRYSALHQIAWGVSDTIAPAICGFLLSMQGSLLWFVLAPLGVVTALVYRVLERPVAGRDGVAGAPLPSGEGT